MKRLLVVDDDDNILDLLVEILSRKFHVVTAVNGCDAFATFNQISFDLLVTDLMMPQMSGIDLVAKIKAENKNFPIIVISGGEPRVLAMARAAGADGFIKKPFEVNDIYFECDRLLGL